MLRHRSIVGSTMRIKANSRWCNPRLEYVVSQGVILGSQLAKRFAEVLVATTIRQVPAMLRLGAICPRVGHAASYAPASAAGR